MDFSYKPQDPSIQDNYDEFQVLCQLPLSATIITQCIEDESETPVIKKSIIKEKLFGNLEQAQFECALHSQLNHDNIVKLLAYTETEKEFILYIEHMNEATLIPDKVIDERTEINVNQLKSFTKDILSALKYLHKNSIIHADLKLENMLC